MSGAMGRPAMAIRTPIISGVDALASGRQTIGKRTAINGKVSTRLRRDRRAPKMRPPTPRRSTPVSESGCRYKAS